MSFCQKNHCVSYPSVSKARKQFSMGVVGVKTKEGLLSPVGDEVPEEVVVDWDPFAVAMSTGTDLLTPRSPQLIPRRCPRPPQNSKDSNFLRSHDHNQKLRLALLLLTWNNKGCGISNPRHSFRTEGERKTLFERRAPVQRTTNLAYVRHIFTYQSTPS